MLLLLNLGRCYMSEKIPHHWIIPLYKAIFRALVWILHSVYAICNIANKINTTP